MSCATPSIEDLIKEEISAYRETTIHFPVIHKGVPRFLPHHEVYELVLLALDILNEPYTCDAIQQARKDHSLIQRFDLAD